jgi:hypothetical protein
MKKILEKTKRLMAEAVAKAQWLLTKVVGPLTKVVGPLIKISSRRARRASIHTSPIFLNETDTKCAFRPYRIISSSHIMPYKFTIMPYQIMPYQKALLDYLRSQGPDNKIIINSRARGPEHYPRPTAEQLMKQFERHSGDRAVDVSSFDRINVRRWLLLLDSWSGLVYKEDTEKDTEEEAGK